MPAIYQIRNLFNNLIYIGSAINPNKRWTDHKKTLKANTHRNSHLQNAFNKYGIENFIFEILENVEDKNNLITREQFWIDWTKCCNRDIGYNLAPIAGSPLGRKLSNETKEKLRQINLGKTHSEETKLKFKNRTYSNETRAKMSLAQSKRKHSEETKELIRIAHLGKEKSEEHKRKVSEGLKKYHS